MSHMQVSFISFLSTDKLQLPGLLFAPNKPTKKAIVWLHAMGDNGVFYKSTLINALAEQATANDMAFLAFNNRGAHNSKSLKRIDDSVPEGERSFQGGSFYELINECVYDIDGAAQFLQKQGYTELYLIGHSTGANKVCIYHAEVASSPFSKYVLSGPGDDSGLFFAEIGEKRFWQALKYAASNVNEQPLRTMPKYSGMHPFSVQSARDILNPDGAYNTFPFYEATTERLGSKTLFKEYRQIDRPCLVVLGEFDEFACTAGNPQAALDLFMKHTDNQQLKKNDFVIVPQADHNFYDQEVALAKMMMDWLSRE